MTQSLIELGLSSYEAAAYVALIHHNASSPTEIAAKAGIPRQRIYDVLASLTNRGFCFCQDTNPKTYFAVDPAIALARLREHQAEEFRQQTQRMNLKGEELLKTLLPIYERSAHSDRTPPNIEVLTEQTQMAARSFELIRSAKQEMNLCIRPPFKLPIEVNDEFIEAASHGRMKCKILFQESLLSDSHMHEWARKFIDRGHQVRVLDSVPVKLTIFDSRAAILTVQDHNDGPVSFTSTVINHNETVQFLRAGFDLLWSQADEI
jgi:HTH-type transcriptional regulator, sugar sensing transcriptional regulator